MPAKRYIVRLTSKAPEGHQVKQTFVRQVWFFQLILLQIGGQTTNISMAHRAPSSTPEMTWRGV